jgi:hypothetical protein
VAEIGFALGSGPGGEPNFACVSLFVFSNLGGVNWVRVPIFFLAGSGFAELAGNSPWIGSSCGLACILVRLCMWLGEIRMFRDGGPTALVIVYMELGLKSLFCRRVIADLRFGLVGGSRLWGFKRR